MKTLIALMLIGSVAYAADVNLTVAELHSRADELCALDRSKAKSWEEKWEDASENKANLVLAVICENGAVESEFLGKNLNPNNDVDEGPEDCATAPGNTCPEALVQPIQIGR